MDKQTELDRIQQEFTDLADLLAASWTNSSSSTF
mgnify:CR=1 FL=1